MGGLSGIVSCFQSSSVLCGRSLGLRYVRCSGFYQNTELIIIKGGNLLLGHRLLVSREPNGQIFRRWQAEIPNDGLLRYLDVFNTEIIVPVGPKALAEILVHKSHDFIKPPQLVSALGKILGVGLFLAEGDQHKRQRKALTPAFAYRQIKELYPVFWNKSRDLVEVLTLQNKPVDLKNKSQSKPVNVNEWASRASLDIIGIAGLGRDFDSIKDPTNELCRTYNNLFSLGRSGKILSFLSFILPRWIVSNLP